MRRITVFNNVSADGYFAGPDGNLDWVGSDPEIDKEVMSGPREIDTVLFGRRTYELFEAFWPNALTDSPVSPNPHDPQQLTPEVREMAVFLNDATKLVFSRTLEKATWKKTQIIREFDPGKIEEMKHGPGADMIIFGSGSIVTQFTKHRLIDEYQFVVRPILLGQGLSMLRDVPTNLPLRLLEAKGYPSGGVLLRYEPVK